jgi:hypothetical protein
LWGVEFQYWVLEWPSKAAFRWIWPGLPNEFLSSLMSPPGRRHGANCLSSKKPLTDVLTFDDDDNVGQALEIWQHGCAWTTWLVLDMTQPIFYGSVLMAEGDYVDNNDDSNPLELCGWIQWLRLVVARLS